MYFYANFKMFQFEICQVNLKFSFKYYILIVCIFQLINFATSCVVGYQGYHHFALQNNYSILPQYDQGYRSSITIKNYLSVVDKL